MENDFQEKNQDFGIISNRIAYYYKNIFNVEIVSLLYRKKNSERVKRVMQNADYLDKLRGEEFDFNVLIKDNNKSCFKYKLIKCNFVASEYIANNEKFDLLEALYYFVDKNLSDYCQKRYLNKATRSKMQEILEKDRELNEEYKNWAKVNKD